MDINNKYAEICAKSLNADKFDSENYSKSLTPIIERLSFENQKIRSNNCENGIQQNSIQKIRDIISQRLLTKTKEIDSPALYKIKETLFSEDAFRVKDFINILIIELSNTREDLLYKY